MKRKGFKPLDLDFQPGQLGSPILSYEEVDSTMNVARELQTAGFPIGTVVLADRQTEGRGRADHRWESPAGKNLYLSVLMKPLLEEKNKTHLTHAIAVALAQTISQFADAPVKIKWPNDIFVDGRKIGGILIEEREGAFVVGIGVNVNTDASDFSPEVARIATSLKMATGKSWDRINVILRQLLHNLNLWTEKLPHGWSAIKDYVDQSFYLKNKRVRIRDGNQMIEGTVVGITGDAGALMIKDSLGETHTVYAGDIEMIDSGTV